MPELPDIVTIFALALSFVCAIEWFGNYEKMQDMKRQIDDLKRQLEELKGGEAD